MDKNLSLRMIVVLVVVSALSGLILSYTWNASAEKIKTNEGKKINSAIMELNPTAKTIETATVEGDTVYYAIDETGKKMSVTFIAEGNGFQATVKALVSMTLDLKQMIGMRILEQSDTPGLGAKMVEPAFYEQFTQMPIGGALIQCIKGDAKKDNSEIKAITASTISSRAVVKLINTKVESFRKVGLQ